MTTFDKQQAALDDMSDKYKNWACSDLDWGFMLDEASAIAKDACRAHRDAMNAKDRTLFYKYCTRCDWGLYEYHSGDLCARCSQLKAVNDDWRDNIAAYKDIHDA